MQPSTPGIAREGYPAIFLFSFAALIFGLLDWEFPAFVFLLLAAFSLHFFRDPARVTPQQDGIAISPADGKVIRIAERPDPVSGLPCTCLSIFMNVFSVHVNRSPVWGTVKAVNYVPGAFFNAAWDKASTNNERCAVQVEDHEGRFWTFVQISGLIARRIVCRAEIGDELKRGERFGMIRFGSRVDLYVPEGYDVAVNIGECVFAGHSIVARKRGQAGSENAHS